jgi:hypothetical protein
MLARMSKPVLVPKDEPLSQGYQESCIHSACAEDAVVPPSDHALKRPLALAVYTMLVEHHVPLTS